ncbi:MAG: glycosyltransferase family 39 protein [Bacteroidota bacterium]
MQKPWPIKLLPLFPLLLFFFNFISKFLFLTEQGLGIDEPFTVYHAQFEFAEIIHYLGNYNNPPLFELLLHIWIKIFGISTLSVRFLPLLFASFCPVALFFFARNNLSLFAAIGSSALLSCSSLLTFYAHDCRVYSLFLLLCILSMDSFFKLIKGRKSEFTFVFFGVLLMYAHYFGIFILLFQGLFLLIFNRGKLLKFFYCYAAIFIFYLPHAYVLTIRLNDSVVNGTWLFPPDGINDLYNILWSFSNEPVVTVICITLLVSALLKLMAQRNFSNVPPATAMILIWFLLPYFGLFFISYAIPVYISRYLIFALPAYYILLVAAVNELLSEKVQRNIALMALIGMFVFTTDLNPDKKHDPAPAINMLARLKDQGTLVIVTPKDFLPTFAYHYNKNYFSGIQPGGEYNLADSLLKNDHVFLLNNVAELSAIDFAKYKKLMYFTAGNKKNPMTDNLTSSFRETNRIQFKDHYYLSVFALR